MPKVITDSLMRINHAISSEVIFDIFLFWFICMVGLTIGILAFNKVSEIIDEINYKKKNGWYKPKVKE